MCDFYEQIKPQVRALHAYTLAPEHARVKVNQNENAFELPEAIKQASVRRLLEQKWSRYPEFTSDELNEQIARFNGWRANGVLAGNGSNELIQALLMVTLEANKKMLICEPTFALYRQVATVFGGEVVSVPLASDFHFDADALLDAARRESPSVTIICSPNNPTGTCLAESALVELLETCGGIVAVDEAYFEFAESTIAGLLKRFENLVVLRTFSKAMAMAGLRAGYLLAAPALAREIGKALLPYNLDLLSQTTVQVALEMYDAELVPLIRKLIAERARLHDAIANIEGLMPYRSRANFILVRSIDPLITPREIFAEMLKRDCLIRNVSGNHPSLAGCFRVSVGTPEENDHVIKSLRDTFDEKRTRAVSEAERHAETAAR